MLKNTQKIIKEKDKESLYATYLDLYKYDAIDYKKISKNKIYEEIVNFFIYVPENIYFYLSENTLEALVEDKPLSLNPEYEDVMTLLDLCVIYLDKTIDTKNGSKDIYKLNEDFKEVISYLKEDISSALIETNLNDFLKGIIDLYGFLSFDDYYKFYKDIFISSPYDYSCGDEFLSKDEFIERVLNSYIPFSCSFNEKYIYKTIFASAFKNSIEKISEIIKSNPYFKKYKQYDIDFIMNYANSYENPSVNSDVYNDASISSCLRVLKGFSLLPTLEYIYNEKTLNGLKEEELKKIMFVHETTPKWLLKGHTINDIKLKENKNKIKFKKINKEIPVFNDESYLDYRNLICDIYEFVASKNHYDYLNLKEMENVDMDDFLSSRDKFLLSKNKYLDDFIKNRKEKITSKDLEIINSMRNLVSLKVMVLDLTNEGLIVLDFINNIRLLVKPLSVPFYELFKYYNKYCFIDLSFLPYKNIITYDAFLIPQEMNAFMFNTDINDLENFNKLKLIKTAVEFIEFYKEKKIL